MEFIVELLLELLIDGGIQICKNKRINKIVRYVILCLLIFIFGGIIGLLFLLGIMIWKQNRLAGLFIIMIVILLLIGFILKFRKEINCLNEKIKK